MNWVDARLKAYKKGAKATFLEQRNLEHANPVLFTCLVLTGIGLVYGLWMHDEQTIVFSCVLALLGHAYVWC